VTSAPSRGPAPERHSSNTKKRVKDDCDLNQCLQGIWGCVTRAMVLKDAATAADDGAGVETEVNGKHSMMQSLWAGPVQHGAPHQNVMEHGTVTNKSNTSRTRSVLLSPRLTTEIPPTTHTAPAICTSRLSAHMSDTCHAHAHPACRWHAPLVLLEGGVHAKLFPCPQSRTLLST
jgi:hypothetical protein